MSQTFQIGYLIIFVLIFQSFFKKRVVFPQNNKSEVKVQISCKKFQSRLWEIFDDNQQVA